MNCNAKRFGGTVGKSYALLEVKVSHVGVCPCSTVGEALTVETFPGLYESCRVEVFEVSRGRVENKTLIDHNAT